MLCIIDIIMPTILVSPDIQIIIIATLNSLCLPLPLFLAPLSIIIMNAVSNDITAPAHAIVIKTEFIEPTSALVLLTS